MKNKLKAFTLAETLITLVIIGVVAAITIPSLMQSTQDAELKTAWKKAYANLSNATNQIVQENGGSIAGLCSNYGHNCVRDLYKPYLKYQKSCDKSESIGNCWHKMDSFWYLDGSTVTSFDPAISGLILDDGSFVYFYISLGTCDDVAMNVTKCGIIGVDVNGYKKPNKFGKDIFSVHLFKDKIKPYGTQEDSYYKVKCEGSTGVNSGRGCGAEYLAN